MGFLRGQALANVFLCEHLQVGIEFLLEVFVELPASEQSVNSASQDLEPIKHRINSVLQVAKCVMRGGRGVR
ncbi:MAG: hypothetical protein ACRD3O_10730 [Terriglobia bacterium]